MQRPLGEAGGILCAVPVGEGLAQILAERLVVLRGRPLHGCNGGDFPSAVDVCIGHSRIKKELRREQEAW